MNLTRRVVVAAGLVFAAALAGCSSSAGSGPSTPKGSQLNGQPSGGTYQGLGLNPAQPRPSFTLTDTQGKEFSFAQRTAGHPTLLFFGYTKCPDVCPQTMSDASLALKSLSPQLQRETFVVFVSTDVKRDTAPVLAQWLTNFSVNNTATYVGLRGTQAQINAAQTVAHVIVAEDGGQTHSAQVLLYGVDDYARVTFVQATDERQQIAHDLPLVAQG